MCFDISDPISLLNYLFLGGKITGPDGVDITRIGCALYASNSVNLPCHNACDMHFGE